MSNLKSFHFCFSGIMWNQDVTADVLRHWLRPVIFRNSALIAQVVFADASDLKFGRVYEPALWMAGEIFFMVFECDEGVIVRVTF